MGEALSNPICSPAEWQGKLLTSGAGHQWASAAAVVHIRFTDINRHSPWFSTYLPLFEDNADLKTIGPRLRKRAYRQLPAFFRFRVLPHLPIVEG